MFIYVSFVHKFCKQCLFPVPLPLPLPLWALFVCLTQLSLTLFLFLLLSHSIFPLCKLINVAKTSHFTKRRKLLPFFWCCCCANNSNLCWFGFFFSCSFLLFSGISLNVKCLSQDSCLLLEDFHQEKHETSIFFPLTFLKIYIKEFSFAENYNCSHYFVTFEMLFSAKIVIIKMISLSKGGELRLRVEQLTT